MIPGTVVRGPFGKTFTVTHATLLHTVRGFETWDIRMTTIDKPGNQPTDWWEGPGLDGKTTMQVISFQRNENE